MWSSVQFELLDWDHFLHYLSATCCLDAGQNKAAGWLNSETGKLELVIDTSFEPQLLGKKTWATLLAKS